MAVGVTFPRKAPFHAGEGSFAFALGVFRSHRPKWPSDMFFPLAGIRPGIPKSPSYLGISKKKKISVEHPTAHLCADLPFVSKDKPLTGHRKGLCHLPRTGPMTLRICRVIAIMQMGSSCQSFSVKSPWVHLGCNGRGALVMACCPKLARWSPDVPGVAHPCVRGGVGWDGTMEQTSPFEPAQARTRPGTSAFWKRSTVRVSCKAARK
jgi:hypothetical protein